MCVHIHIHIYIYIYIYIRIYPSACSLILPPRGCQVHVRAAEDDATTQQWPTATIRPATVPLGTEWACPQVLCLIP